MVMSGRPTSWTVLTDIKRSSPHPAEESVKRSLHSDSLESVDEGTAPGNGCPKQSGRSQHHPLEAESDPPVYTVIMLLDRLPPFSGKTRIRAPTRLRVFSVERRKGGYAVRCL